MPRLRGTGRHRAPTLAEYHDLEDRLAASEKKADDIAFDYCDLEQDYKAAVAEIRRLQDRVIRGAAEHERLRQALRQARPRITEVPAQAERPTEPDSIPLHLAPHAA